MERTINVSYITRSVATWEVKYSQAGPGPWPQQSPVGRVLIFKRVKRILTKFYSFTIYWWGIICNDYWCSRNHCYEFNNCFLLEISHSETRNNNFFCFCLSPALLEPVTKNIVAAQYQHHPSKLFRDQYHCCCCCHTIKFLCNSIEVNPWECWPTLVLGRIDNNPLVYFSPFKLSTHPWAVLSAVMLLWHPSSLPSDTFICSVQGYCGQGGWLDIKSDQISLNTE